MTRLERHALELGALGHPSRLGILREVVKAGKCGLSLTDLQAQLHIPWTTLNHHVARLAQAGLVTVRKEGKFALHTADYEALRALTDFLWEDCCKGGKGCC
jgi:DNA-binding transcriptional ArsR family regulator